MNNEHSSPVTASLGLAVVFGITFLITWPAILAGYFAHRYISKRVSNLVPYWIVGLSLVSIVGILLTLGNSDFLLSLGSFMHDMVLLATHFTLGTLFHFVLAALSVWVRSLVLTPMSVVAIEIWYNRSFERRLLLVERRRQAQQVQRSRAAAQQIQHTPDQINGKGVLGVLIEEPNQ